MRRERSDWGWLSLTLLLSLLILLPTLWFGFGSDQGLLSYGAWIWRKFGMAPYAYIFDGNLPGIYLIHYLAQALFGDSVTGFRVFDLIWQLATALLIYRVAAQIFRDPGAGLSAAVFYSLYYTGLGHWDAGQREGFMTCFYLLSFLILFRGYPRPIPLGSAGWAGLAMGLAFLIKPVAALPGLFLAALILKYSARRLSGLGLFIIMSGFPFFAAVFYYWRIHHFPELFQNIFVYTTQVYLGSARVGPAFILKGLFLVKPLLANPLTGLGAILFLAGSRKGEGQSRALNFWLIGLIAAIYLSYLVQGKFLSYHLIPVFSFVCLASGLGWSRLLKKLGAERGLIWQRAGWLVLLLVVFSLSCLDQTRRQSFLNSLRLSPAKAQDSYLLQLNCRLAADYLKARTGPEDTIQVWGVEGMVNYFAERRSPTRFPQVYPLMVYVRGNQRAPLQKELADQFFRQLQSDPPAYFLVQKMSNLGFGIDNYARVLTEDYPEIWRFVTRNYSPEYRIGVFTIYRLRKTRSSD